MSELLVIAGLAVALLQVFTTSPSQAVFWVGVAVALLGAAALIDREEATMFMHGKPPFDGEEARLLGGLDHAIDQFHAAVENDSPVVAREWADVAQSSADALAALWGAEGAAGGDPDRHLRVVGDS